MRPQALRIGFVSVIRPAFKGASVAAAGASVAELERLGDQLGFQLVLPHLTHAVRTADGSTVPPYAVSEAEAAALAASQLRAADLDLLLIQHTTFATGELLAPLLSACERTGVWALPERGTGAGDTAGTSGPLPRNSLCGLNMTLSYLSSPEVNKQQPVKWFYGPADSSRFVERLAVTVAALRGLRALESARVLQIGGAAPGFYGLGEELELEGPKVDSLPLAQFLERIAAVDASKAAVLAAEQAALEPHDVTKEQLERSARIELALTALAEEGDYHALAVRCWPELPERCGSMACAAMGNLSRAVPAACEGDVVGALSMLTLQAVSGGPSVLMDLSDVDEDKDELLFWHCGNAPLEWAVGRASRLMTHFNRDGVGVIRDMVLAPGRVTAFRLVGGDSASVMSGNLTDPQRASYDGVRGWLGDLSWNGSPVSAEGFVANVLDNRLAHHFAFGRGEWTSALQELCTWLGREPVPGGAAGPTLMPFRG